MQLFWKRNGVRPFPTFLRSSLRINMSVMDTGTKAAPNNYLSDRVSGDTSVIAEPLRRSNPGATTGAASATQTVVLRPLDCFASLAMTDRQLAHLFLRVA